MLAIAGILLLSLLIACAPEEEDDDGGGSADTYTVGGTITGHAGEVSLALTYGEKTETLKIEAGTDKFTFVTKLEANQSFTIAVTNPAGQTCSSSLNQGTVVDANITNIEVTCVVNTYSLSGEVSGLANGDTVTLTLSPTGGTVETEDVTGDADETADEPFTFDTRLLNSATYEVTTTSPTGKKCTVAPAGEQTVADADVTDITVTCLATYSVSGTVTGLAENETITLTLSPIGGTADDKVITDDADETTYDAFTFDTELAAGDTYTVTTTSPAGKTCTVAPAGTQTMGDGDVIDVAITCALITYSVSGTVARSGTSGALYVVLTIYDDNTGTNPTKTSFQVNTDGIFSFTGILENKFYTLQVSSGFGGETCSATPTTPTQVIADVIGVQITCSISTGPFLQIEVISESFEASLATVNVFIGDSAITDTSGTATQVIKGTDSDVIIVRRSGLWDFFYYNVSIDAGQYYAVTTSTASTNEDCTVVTPSGGPITDSVLVEISCD